MLQNLNKFSVKNLKTYIVFHKIYVIGCRIVTIS